MTKGMHMNHKETLHFVQGVIKGLDAPKLLLTLSNLSPTQGREG